MNLMKVTGEWTILTLSCNQTEDYPVVYLRQTPLFHGDLLIECKWLIN